MGGGVVNVVKAPALVVEVGPNLVRIAVVVTAKIGHWDGPLHRRCSNDPAGPEWKNSKSEKAELGMYKS